MEQNVFLLHILFDIAQLFAKNGGRGRWISVVG